MTKKISKRDIKTLEEILRTELFTDLVGETPKKLQKKLQKGKVPKSLTEKVYFIYEITEYLQGSYDYQGIRNWFDRERVELENNSPSQYLGFDWKPEDEYAKRVLELARSLKG